MLTFEHSLLLIISEGAKWESTGITGKQKVFFNDFIKTKLLLHEVFA